MPSFVLIVVVLSILLANISYQVPPVTKKQGGSNDDGPKENLSNSILVNQMTKMFDTEIYFDVKFSIKEGNKQKFLHAHKNILVTSSNVFEEMWGSDTNKLGVKVRKTTGNVPAVVTVVGIKESTFKIMLKYIYTNDLSGLNAKNAMEVFNAAIQYNIKGLIEACFALPNYNPPNTFFAYAKAQFLNEKELIQKYLAYIDQNADKLLKSEQFLKITQKMLIAILERDQLMVKDELSIWEAALRWADEQCDQNGIGYTASNKRQMLGPALYKIRFPLIPQHNFDGIADSGVLPDEDVIRIYQYYVHQQFHYAMPLGASGEWYQRYPLQFSAQNRNYPKSRGRITFTIKQFANFSDPKSNSTRSSDVVHVCDLKWHVKAKKEIKDQGRGLRLEFFLEIFVTDYSAPRNWSGTLSAKLIIVSQEKGKENLTIMLPKKTYDIREYSWRFPMLARFQDLMDPDNGWYNKEEDSMTVMVEFIVEEPKTVKKV